MTNVERALRLVTDGMFVGLGSGRAAERFIHALAALKLAVRCVATSNASAALAQGLGLALVDIGEADSVDIAIDGADEVDPHCNLIKGYGHAHVREKIVASMAREFVVLIGPDGVEEKLVPVLGTRGKLPVEVLAFGLVAVQRRLAAMGLPADVVRDDAGNPRRSDNGNLLLESRVGPIDDPARLEADLRGVPGIVGTGLFVGMADRVLIERDGLVEERRP